MELVELWARFAVAMSALGLLGAGLAVLFREQRSGRPAPIERDSGPLMLVNFVGIVGFVVVGLASAVTLAGTIEPWNEPLDTAVRLVGIAALVAAGLLAVWGIRSIGEQMSSQAEIRPDTSVVTTGAFGLVRHPLYLSILLLWAGAALALLSWLLALCWLGLIPAFVARARLEERLLARHLGPAYDAYTERVPMLVPGWRGRARARSEEALGRHR